MDSATGTIAVAMKLKITIARNISKNALKQKTPHNTKALAKDKNIRVVFFILLSAKRIQKGLDVSSTTAGMLPRIPF